MVTAGVTRGLDVTREGVTRGLNQRWQKNLPKLLGMESRIYNKPYRDGDDGHFFFIKLGALKFSPDHIISSESVKSAKNHRKTMRLLV